MSEDAKGMTDISFAVLRRGQVEALASAMPVIPEEKRRALIEASKTLAPRMRMLSKTRKMGTERHSDVGSDMQDSTAMHAIHPSTTRQHTYMRVAGHALNATSNKSAAFLTLSELAEGGTRLRACAVPDLFSFS